ncbi:MAG: hypothetical protein ABI231_10915 [Candidatus Tumulicola sp.]
MQQRAVSRSLALDYAVGLCGVWVSSGFFLDAWAHGHVPVESFFTPYHGVFYSGMLAMLVLIAAFVLRNRRRGYGWAESIPRPYRLALVGVPIFLGAAGGDMMWHRLLGLEEGVDALLSPTHQVIGLGIFFLASGPIRSVLADRERSTSLVRQLPLVLGLATWLILAHFGTAYAFDPGAGRTDAPPPIAPFTPDYLTALSIGYYKISIGVLIVILQSAIVSGFALWLVSRIRLFPGMLTIFYVIGTVPAAAAFTNQTSLLAVTVAQALVTGVVADVLIARWDPQPENPSRFRWFAAIVPMTYILAYLLGTLATDGLWWDWNIALGAWIWSGVCGFALSLVATARRAA